MVLAPSASKSALSTTSSLFILKATLRAMASQHAGTTLRCTLYCEYFLKSTHLFPVPDGLWTFDRILFPPFAFSRPLEMRHTQLPSIRCSFHLGCSLQKSASDSRSQVQYTPPLRESHCRSASLSLPRRPPFLAEREHRHCCRQAAATP